MRVRSQSPTPVSPQLNIESYEVPRTRRSQSRREFLRGAWGTGTAAPAVEEQQVASATTAAPTEWADSRLRLVRRASMGLSAFEVSEVKRLGYQAWLQDQVFYEGIDDSALDAVIATRYPLLSQTAGQLVNANQGTLQNQLQEATIYRAAFSRRQLYERMVEFWSDHFNIAISKVGYLKAVDDRDVIRKHALGKFSDLLKASAHSPAMLAYLDQNTSRVGSPNQNYVRELMELHTLGVDGGYTQTDVENLARVFTGWTFTGAGDFNFQSNRHDFGQKIVLGVTVPATPTSTGSAAINEGEQMLDLLINHPSTAKFISTKLLKWLLTPEPTSSQVRTIANVWRATKGDIKLVVRAILNEGWVATAPRKFKRPFHYIASTLRATQPNTTSVANMNSQVRTLGQQLFFYETPDGYPDTAEYWSGNMPPRWNFANTLVGLTTQTVVDTAPYLAGSQAAAIDKIQSDFFGNELPSTTRQALLTYLNGGTFNATRVRETIALALSSAEFQWY
jgi:uncharacterized protein (DUF1800 family)